MDRESLASLYRTTTNGRDYFAIETCRESAYRSFATYFRKRNEKAYLRDIRGLGIVPTSYHISQSTLRIDRNSTQVIDCFLANDVDQSIRNHFTYRYKIDASLRAHIHAVHRGEFPSQLIVRSVRAYKFVGLVWEECRAPEELCELFSRAEYKQQIYDLVPQLDYINVTREQKSVKRVHFL